MAKVTLAYAAGVFDGEGCVDVGRSRSTYRVRARVINTDRSLLESIQETFGGTIYTRKRAKGTKQAYEWVLNGDAAVAFLKRLKRYLIVKLAVAKVALTFAVQKAKAMLTKPQFRDTTPLDMLIKAARALNKRGHAE